MQNPHFGSKIKISKNMLKSILQIIYSCSVQKTARKNTKYSRKINYVENRPSCKGYSPCKILNMGQKLKFEKMSLSILQIIYSCSVQKNCSKNTKYSRRKDYVENRPSCKSHSPLKILHLGQKLQFQKPCQNPFYNSFRVVLCKKPLEKTPNTREMRAF